MLVRYMKLRPIPRRILLEAGADIACVDNEGQLPIDKAEDDDDMRQLLADWMRKKGNYKRAC